MTIATLAPRVRAVLDRHWRAAGYTVPNGETYPFLWLWDSCFHAILWAALGDSDRAVTELSHVFRTQDALGFVPHIDYEAVPDHHATFWGRRGASSITQPPLYGHAVAELARRGVDVPDDVIDAARRGLRFLLQHRRRDPATGLITVVHPWETGCDASPRWDHWGAADVAAWYRVKGELLASVEWSSSGAPLANPAFPVAPASFNALVAWNASELGAVTGDESLAADAVEISDALAAQWNGERCTWLDVAPARVTSAAIRTLDGLLPALVSSRHRDDALALVVDSAAYGAPFGPRGVHRDEPQYDPSRYWRGGTWAPLAYLLWRAGADVAATATRGALSSGLAEYWDPETGAGLGAIPQSWTGLVMLMA